ncbi:EAL domain-containing protein [Hyphococcus luteus]|uniref:EAL domain-containing protein n=1 Tax=Hyphococcus luteus TaxID=2058213 RepID=UPI0013FE2CDC|nr:EAL domain-containing protein [Marinicaulis flavus]
MADGFSGLAQAELLRGAVAGAFIVAMAFLAGYAAIRRSGLAVCALLMVMAAGGLEFSRLGFLSALPGEATVMMQALFAAAAIVFLSASIGAARYNPLLGGVMFTAALVIGGMGIINFFERIDLAPMMRWALIGVGGFAVLLSLTQALRGDSGARLVLPGVVLAAAAPLLGLFGSAEGGVMAFASHGLFTLGILAASMIALTETGLSQAIEPRSIDFGVRTSHDAPSRHKEVKSARERAEIVLDSQIARVLDYSGVAIWDWSPEAIDQTDSLPALLGADSDAPFTPEALRNFIHADDAARFDSELLAPVDGPFDVCLKLFDGRMMRMRGARAADEGSGEIERLVAFVEPLAGSPINEARLKYATESAIVPPAAADPMTSKLSAALANGDIAAAFQPIVSLEDGKVSGYEALARWRGQEEGAEEGPERFVKAAERIGEGGALAATMLDQAAVFLADALEKEKRRDLFVAMNVSWGQIREEGFLEKVRETVAKYDLPDNALVLELTEADAVSDATLAFDVFRKLKASGVALAFDDFGAGFTCLSNLRKYDFDYLKIDKSFTNDLETDGDGAKIVASLASLGKELGLKVIIEGVESKADSAKARKMGCAFGQGFAFGRPVMSETAPAPATASAGAPEEEAPAENQRFTASEPEETAAAPAEEKRALAMADAGADADVGAEAGGKPEGDEADFAEEDAMERKHRRWRFWGGAQDLR